jgi:hypothetical protein
MTANEAYVRFLTKVNQNLKSNNVSAGKDRFVLLFNEEQQRLVDYTLDKKNEDYIRNIQKLLVTDTLPKLSEDNNKAIFDLPSNYYELSSAHAFGKKEGCGQDRISLFEIKDFDSEEIVTDDNNKPDWDYRQAPYYIGEDKVKVFYEDFTLDSVYLTYYRKPRNIDLAGYIKIDGAASTNVDPEMDDEFTNRVISMCAESFFRNYPNPNSVTLNKDRIITNT